MTMKRSLARGLALAVIGLGSLLLGLGALAADSPKTAVDPLHGAAPNDKQFAELDKLLAKEHPAGIDKQIWEASVPKDNAMTPERIALGRKLYFETALSKDGTVSCATCHDTTRSFTDLRATSEGVGGQIGKRNAPTTMNAALLQTQFWDGRNATLEQQAGQPILNPVEMAMPDEKTALAAIKDNPEYKELFKKAYGRDVNYKDLERAIATFERTLIFLDAPFDKFLSGNEDAISKQAKAGWELFNGNGRCMSCHPISLSNPLGTDNRMHNVGVSARHQNFEQLAQQALVLMKADTSERKLDELAVGTDMSELGRFMVTKNYADIGSFRTPQIRNIGITGPYMHDGSLPTLWDVMDHYNKGGETNPYLDGGMEALDLSEEEIDQLVAFLFTLTDVRFDDKNKAEVERQRTASRKERKFKDDDQAGRKVLLFEQRVMGKPTKKGD